MHVHCVALMVGNCSYAAHLGPRWWTLQQLQTRLLSKSLNFIPKRGFETGERLPALQWLQVANLPYSRFPSDHLRLI
jgi:hypothetical protein